MKSGRWKWDGALITVEGQVREQTEVLKGTTLRLLNRGKRSTQPDSATAAASRILRSLSTTDSIELDERDAGILARVGERISGVCASPIAMARIASSSRSRGRDARCTG